MAGETSIAWTDATFNPWIGCTKVSPGCDNCYAEAQDHRWGHDRWGKGKERTTTSESYWKQPLKWDHDAYEAGKIAKVFCGSLCDVMDEEAPVGQRERLWALVDQTPNLLWQLLTKRPHHYRKMLPVTGFRHDNVILGTTTESQAHYNARIDELVLSAECLTFANKLRSGFERKRVKTFVSYEPAIGPLSFRSNYKPDWLIFGGETGDGRRQMETKWAEDIKAECEEFDVAFFMKQMSAFRPATAANLIPAHLLVRQFPA